VAYEVKKIHPVELVAGEDQNQIGLQGKDVYHALANRVRCSLKPRGALVGLFSRKD
jgi:hypothetical protein